VSFCAFLWLKFPWLKSCRIIADKNPGVISMKKLLLLGMVFSAIWVVGAQPQPVGPIKAAFGQNKPVPPPVVPEAPASSIMLG
jgi:hypothetical protein